MIKIADFASWTIWGQDDYGYIRYAPHNAAHCDIAASMLVHAKVMDQVIGCKLFNHPTATYATVIPEEDIETVLARWKRRGYIFERR